MMKKRQINKTLQFDFFNIADNLTINEDGLLCFEDEPIKRKDKYIYVITGNEEYSQLAEIKRKYTIFNIDNESIVWEITNWYIHTLIPDNYSIDYITDQKNGNGTYLIELALTSNNSMLGNKIIIESEPFDSDKKGYRFISLIEKILDIFDL